MQHTPHKLLNERSEVSILGRAIGLLPVIYLSLYLSRLRINALTDCHDLLHDVSYFEAERRKWVSHFQFLTPYEIKNVGRIVFF